jgi:hypothetical protein
VRHDGQLDVGPVALGEEGVGEQRELVQRQRPADGAWKGEDEPAKLALDRPREQLAVALDVDEPTEGEGSVQCLARTRTAGDQERVVLELGASRRQEEVLRRVDGREPVEREAGSEAGGHAAEVDALDLPGSERLGDREGPVPEVRLCGDQVDRHAVPGERPKREERLEPGDAAACDDHANDR